MDRSIFTKKELVPEEQELKFALGDLFEVWKEICDYTFNTTPGLTGEWNYSGIKYGWSFRIKDKKRAIIYLLPRNQYFKVAFVFGQKAVDEILKGPFSEQVKRELESARIYAEGRGIRIDIKNREIFDIKRLTDIKIKF